jgi:regulatory protein
VAARVVTAVQPRTDLRVAIELDGNPWLVLDALVATELGIYVDASLSTTTKRKAEQNARAARALDRAAAMVGRRSHARGELEQRIAKREGADAARMAADRLESIGALDDTRHAAEVAAHRLASGWGTARIAHDLEVAGVDQAEIQACLQNLDDAVVERAAVLAIGARTGAEAWQRLASRGFDESVAERLVRLPLDD